MIRIGPPSPDRAEELYAAVSKVFSHIGQSRFARFCREAYFANSGYDWRASRVLEADGRIVSHVGVWAYRMRVGGARLRTGGIGAVMTAEDCRRRGYGRRLMRATVASMRDAGYHLSMLFGRRDYYHHFGYVQAWPSRRCVVETADLPAGPLRLRLRKVPLKQALCGRGTIMRIYNRENARRTGTAERPIYTRPGALWLDAECRTLSDAAGRVRGYVITRRTDEGLRVDEVGGLGRRGGVGQVLAAVRTLARRAGCERVVVPAHADNHPLCAALREGDCRVERTYRRSGGPMVVAIDLAGCLRAMAGELGVRLRSSAMKGFRGSLAVGGAGERAVLRLAAGRVRVEARSSRTRHRIAAGRHVARLLIGSEPPSVLARQSGIAFRGRAAELAEALFPAQWPMLHPIDHY